YRGLAPWMGLLLATAGDFLAVGARLTGSYPGWGAQLTWLAGTCLLGATPAALRRAAAFRRARAQQGQGGQAAQSGSLLPAYAAIAAAAVAALVTLARALSGSLTEPVVLAAAGAVVLALAARLTGLVREAASASALSREASRQFSE